VAAAKSRHFPRRQTASLKFSELDDAAIDLPNDRQLFYARRL